MKESLKAILLIAFSIISIPIWAQQPNIKFMNRVGDSVVLINTAIKPKRVKQPPILQNSLSGGVRISSNGFGILFDFGKLYGNSDFGMDNRNKFFQSRIFEFSVSEILHPKEIKSNTAMSGLPFQPGSYALGKINNFYQANLGYGYSRLIAGKPDLGTVSIHWVYLGGFSAGLLKPYYLNLYNLGSVKYAEDIQTEFVTPDLIMGKAGFSKGLNEIKLVPGVFFKTGLHFDFSSRDKGIMALETGVYGSYYFQQIEQMVGQTPQQLFFSFYASFQFGGRW